MNGVPYGKTAHVSVSQRKGLYLPLMVCASQLDCLNNIYLQIVCSHPDVEGVGAVKIYVIVLDIHSRFYKNADRHNTSAQSEA